MRTFSAATSALDRPTSFILQAQLAEHQQNCKCDLESAGTSPNCIKMQPQLMPMLPCLFMSHDSAALVLQLARSML